MVKKNRTAVFVTVIFCAAVLLALFSKKALSQVSIPANISFAAESNAMYFLDRDTGKVYRYNTQGRLTRTYTVKELGKDLELR
jgi:hypothetical protein